MIGINIVVHNAASDHFDFTPIFRSVFEERQMGLGRHVIDQAEDLSLDRYNPVEA
jgi:hypothetical protein